MIMLLAEKQVIVSFKMEGKQSGDNFVILKIEVFSS